MPFAFNILNFTLLVIVADFFFFIDVREDSWEELRNRDLWPQGKAEQIWCLSWEMAMSSPGFPGRIPPLPECNLNAQKTTRMSFHPTFRGNSTCSLESLAEQGDSPGRTRSCLAGTRSHSSLPPGWGAGLQRREGRSLCLLRSRAGSRLTLIQLTKHRASILMT